MKSRRSALTPGILLAGIAAALLVLALAPSLSQWVYADEGDQPPPRRRPTPTPIFIVRPTATPVPSLPTNTPQPTHTSVPVAATATPTAPEPPTATPKPPSPTATLPPTDTPVPPPAATPIPPPPPPTATSVPPLAASAPNRSSSSRVVRTATATPVSEAPAPPKNAFAPPVQPPPVVSQPTPTPVATAPDSPSPDAPQFASVFDELRGSLGTVFGDPLTSEQQAAGVTEPDSCDTQQLTTAGLAYWRCARAAPNFVADDGLHHWTLDSGRLLEWVGTTLDPPDVAMPTDVLPMLNLVCLGPNPSPQDACLLANSTTTAGLVTRPGDDSVYAFQVNTPLAQVHVDLTNLPADYDLYLTDWSGTTLGQSAQEGTLPEAVDASLQAGSYLLFVHSDPGRSVDPDNAFVLHLEVQAPVPADASVTGYVGP